MMKKMGCNDDDSASGWVRQSAEEALKEVHSDKEFLSVLFKLEMIFG
jgi:hypothetical protein